METDSFDSLSGSSEELFRCQYPIHHACREGNLETLNNLLATGDSVNFYEEDGFYGWTPIHWAAHFGKLSCIMKLLEHGSSCDATTERINQSPAHLAALNGKGHCLRWLIQCGAKINRQLACLRKLTSLGDLGCDISGSQFTQTPLHLSAYTGHPHCVQWLVQSGANINSQDYLGETPLHKAARTGSMECVSLLVSLGAKLGLRNHRGLTPSELAAECGKHECAMYIQKAVDIHHQSSGGFQDPSSGGFQDPSNNLEQQDLSHLNFHNGIYLPQQQQWNNQLHPSHMPNGMTNSGEDCGMETNEIGPGGDAVSHNGFIHTAGMKRCRDDEIEDDSIKRCRKTGINELVYNVYTCLLILQGFSRLLWQVTMIFK
ncbi:hypothetical protein FSP39_020110 [Pinctada imbricata]|uniref:Ankyrin repeat domain-containing protein 10 n=1 Tax=Pinctada imbricata TaxID=66713 RepID=A0AA88XW45_PINIB|nr:hypothetical protein FSP39_020110 [Pinctada imbricata]